jgi:cell division protein FtsQ
MATRAVGQSRPAGRSPSRGKPAARGAVLRRRVIAAVIVVVALYGGYMLWFRNLSWFAINDVTVKGATTSQAQIHSAVERAAGDMTTLHINDSELRHAVARFPTIASVSATTSFPHGLTVTVSERLPVAFVQSQGRQTAVSADGYLLPGTSFDQKTLPRIDGASAQGVRLDGDSAAQAAILGATPEPLRDLVTGSTWDDQRGGVVVDLKNGPEVIFGDGSRARDKWTAAVAVLSSPEHGSPSYVNVVVPDKPVSGG